MKKTNFSSLNKTKMLAGTLTFAFLLSGGSAVAASSVVTSLISQSVGTAVYDTSAPVPPQPYLGHPAPPAGKPPLPLGPGLGELQSDALLTVMNLTADQLRQALESGQSLSEIGASQGTNMQKVADLVADALKATLERELNDGHIIQDQFNVRLNEVADRAAYALSRTHPKPPAPPALGTLAPELGLGPTLGPGLEQLNQEALLSLLSISSDKLTSSLRSGQSLSDIAAAQGIDVQKLIDLAAQGLTSRLDQELSEKMIWKDEYETRKQEISVRAADAIQHKHPKPPHPALPPKQAK
ncbi:LysM peptidoglycan-binding domain-containing protein [Paenibacillus sp. WQ 127069]|uniref:LysM peptidoglycan-binding domain-containing protein n=1 Tax=Paenibacillus baimaensis TaxID=2982185 RepID=A0ABT2UA24_9BACL|nr:LysM peptidoglycan-binding domain-containing protein [Paenibacillus sp. WQ 127069]MCU6791031.1 LysM peptidoglycan-binding domain-containing protein [Paenibacillus sp. WQ 127069]